MAADHSKSVEAPSAHPDLHVPAVRPFYRRPLVYAVAAVAIAFGGGFWIYGQHPEWLVNIVEEDATGRGRLENLPEGTNAEDLSFLLDTFEGELPPPAIPTDGDDQSEQPSLLEQFMQGEEQAEDNREQPTGSLGLLEQLNADNPLLNPTLNNSDRQASATNPLGNLLSNGGNGNANASPLRALLNGNARDTGNPLQNAIDRLAQPSAAGEASAPAANASPQNQNPSPGAASSLGIDPDTGQPRSSQPNYGIPGQPAIPNAVGGYNALPATDPSNPYYQSLPGQSPPATTTAPTVPLRSQRRSTVTPLLTPSPSSPVPSPAAGNSGQIPGQQFTSPIRQQQQQRSPNAGGNPNQFRRVGGGQINTFSNPLGPANQQPRQR